MLNHALAVAAALLFVAPPLLGQGVGYTDTPVIPGSKWRVHDKDRPNPKVVTPGTATTPPSDAVVLFDGVDLSKWFGRGGVEAGWKIEDGAMVVNGTGDITTKQSFGDCQLHVEFATPSVVKGDSQGRGNSGVFLMDRYEIQVLDSYDNPSYADGQAAALYGQKPPMVNACRGPGQWQVYDIIFTAPRFADGKLVSPAYVTVIHNGVVVHHHEKVLGPTRHKQNTEYQPHAAEAPIHLQDHGNPTRFRNVWVRRLKASAE